MIVSAEGIYAGESTKQSKSARQIAQTAIRIISESVTDGISPEEIASRIGCSRRYADKCLLAIHGKPLHKAIEDMRLDEAQRRLQDGIPVRDIVKSMHFTSANQFYRIFKRHFKKN